MKINALLVCVLLLPACSYAKVCPDTLGISASQGSTLNEQAYYFTPEVICLDGSDISSKLKKYPDDKITGAFSMLQGRGDVFFVSIYSEKHYHGRILLLTDNGKTASGLVIFQNSPGKRPAKPQDSVENIIVNSFDNKTSTLYYSADAWAQAGAVHSLKWTDNKDPLSWKEDFIHDGTFEGVYNGMPIVSTISHDNSGSYFPAYLMRDNGEVFCTLDTREQLWQLSPVCLSAGDDYRKR